MSIRRSSITVFVAMFAASTLSACGDQRQDDAQGPGQEASASAGSGLISAQSGFAEMDLASVKAVKSRSEEHTSELQSLMRISYAVFCLKKKKTNKKIHSRNRCIITKMTSRTNRLTR